MDLHTLNGTMVKSFSTVVFWLAHLFDPPPIALTSLAQKIRRIVSVSLTLTIICFLVAMVLASAFFVLEWLPLAR